MSWFGNLLGSGYTDYRVLGFTYRVAATDDPRGVAYKLHDVNAMAVEIISFIRRWIRAADDGRLSEEDRAVIPIERLRVMYARLADRYDADSVYESRREGGDTSFVINQGEELHMCVEVAGRYERETVLVAVLAHELSHIASSGPDHDAEFWEDYDIMQRLVARMGYVDVRDVTSGGETHCGRVHIGRAELAEIAAGGPNAPFVAARSKSGMRAGMRPVPTDFGAGGAAGAGGAYGVIGASPRRSESGRASMPVPDHAVMPGDRSRYGGGTGDTIGEATSGFNPAFSELHKTVPLGFATDRPIAVGYKTIKPTSGGYQAMNGRVQHMGSVPNPIAMESYSRWG